MAIEVAGGIYCPLSPRDPQQRLHTLVQQTQSRFTLVHYVTKNMFQSDITLVDIDFLLFNSNNNTESEVDVNLLSDVLVTSDDIAFILFTSGSTGTPKAVSQ